MLTSLILAVALSLAPLRATAQEPVVHAVLFYSPTCPHCHEVINNVLPPLHDKYGERFVIAGVDVTQERGAALYRAMAAYFVLPESRLGVPALVVGADLMVGSAEIPERLPGIIEQGLAAGGIDWPPIEEIREALTVQGIVQDRPTAAPQAAPPATQPRDSAPPTPGATAAPPRDTARQQPAPVTPRPAPDTGVAAGAPPGSEDTVGAAATAAALDTTGAAATPTAPDTTAAADTAADTAAGAPTVLDAVLTPDTPLRLERPTTSELFLRDPIGNGIAVVVLILLLVTLGWSVRAMARPGATRAAEWPTWVFPVLGLVGAAVAAYLSLVEVTGAQAVCGPVGDCNAVQQSAWSRLFGFVPVGVVGLVGYAGMLAAWAFATWGPPRTRGRAWRVAWVLAFAGTAFSAWLTFLEPFAIGATCAWCVTSAVVIALMLAVATARASRPGAA